MKRTEYKSGQKIGNVEYLYETKPKISLYRNYRMAMFKCFCGKEFKAIITSVVTGNTNSCGCIAFNQRHDRFVKHGLKQHELYSTWKTMRTRCLNEKCNAYKNYGGRGIAIAVEFDDFKVWLDYVTSLPNYKNRKKLKLTLDRIENNEGYKIGNLKWSTRSEQVKNRRKFKKRKNANCI